MKPFWKREPTEKTAKKEKECAADGNNYRRTTLCMEREVIRE